MISSRLCSILYFVNHTYKYILNLIFKKIKHETNLLASCRIIIFAIFIYNLYNIYSKLYKYNFLFININYIKNVVPGPIGNPNNAQIIANAVHPNKNAIDIGIIVDIKLPTPNSFLYF